MVIQCPECATRFKVADHLVKGKAVKLKCSKCKHVFVTRDGVADTPKKPGPASGPPAEPPVAEARPAAPAKAEPTAPQRSSHPMMPVVRPPGRMTGAPVPAPAPVPDPAPALAPAPAPEPDPAPALAPAPAPEPASAPSLGEYESFEPEKPEPAASPHVPVDDAPDEEPDDGQEQTLDVEPPAPEPAPAPEPTLPDGAAAAEAGSHRQAVAAESSVSMPMLTLEDVMPGQEPQSGVGRTVGIATAVLVALAVVFVIFVLHKNGWDVGSVTSDPFSAVKVALGMQERVVVFEEARGIEASVTEVFVARTGDEREILVVSGEVLNTTAFAKKLVTVEVSIVTSRGEVIKTQQTLAGVTLRTAQEIGDKGYLEMDEELREEHAGAEKWVIRSNRKASFQVFFTTYPPGVQDITLYGIKALAKDARNADSE